MKAKGKEKPSFFSGVNLPDPPKGASQKDKDAHKRLRRSVRRADAAAEEFFSAMEAELSKDIVKKSDLMVFGTFRNRRLG